MEKIKISNAEINLMEMVWKSEPINSTQLVKMAEENLGWKKSTTYTVIKRLSEKGAVENENATVTSCVKRDEVFRSESENLLEKAYNGSLKLFLASFLSKEKLTKSEAKELKQLIDDLTDKR